MSVVEASQLMEEPLSLALPVRSALEKALGYSLSLWWYSEVWRPIPQGDSSPVMEPNTAEAVVQLLSQQDFSKQSATFSFADGRHLLAVPIATEGRVRLLVVGFIEPHAANLVCALADSLIKSHNLSLELETATHELDHCIFQITANFEELTWLRTLAEHFEICSLQDGLARAGQSALPSLRQLIYAEELFLFGMPQHSDSNGSVSGEFPLLSYDGDGSISENSAQILLSQLGNKSSRQSIVWNSPVSGESRFNPAEIRNYILTPVTKYQEQHGWLLAINKNMPLEDPIWNGSETTDQNLIEFGTTEAGLLSTMAVMLATHGKNVELLKEKEALLVGMIRALVNTIDAKDAYTGGHSDRVALVSKRIAQQLGQSALECEQAYMAGLLHDIGKIGVPDSVLGKPDRLTAEEFNLIKMHPEMGVAILKHLKPFSSVLSGVLHHHEAFNGSGYPSGLAGEEIPLLGRILSVADSYDAMTSNRTYRQGMSTEKAEEILRKGIGTYWDERVIEAFFATKSDIYAICGISPAASEAETSPG